MDLDVIPDRGRRSRRRRDCSPDSVPDGSAPRRRAWRRAVRETESTGLATEVRRHRAELVQDVLAARDHLGGVVGSDVGGEELALAGLGHGRLHGQDHLRDALVHLAERLVALRLIVLDDVFATPESIAGFNERLWLQSNPSRHSKSHKTALTASSASV